MNCHVYLRNRVVYLPTMGKMDEGFYRGIEPVAVASVSNAEAMRQALQTTIARGNPTVPVLRRSEYPPPVLLKYAGVKSWSVFARGTAFWTLKEKGGFYRIAGQKKQCNGGWTDDPEQMTSLPPGTALDQVVERMIAILQDASHK